MAPASRTASVLLGVLLTLPTQVLGFATVPSLAGKNRHQQRFLQSDVITARIATLPNKAGVARRRDSAMKAGFAAAPSGGGDNSLTSTLTQRGRGPSWRWRRFGSSRLRVLGDGGDCDSEEECEIIYDDDEDVAAPTATATTTTADEVEGAPAATATTTTTTTTEAEGGQEEGGAEGDAGRERAELDHREKVLDDGYQKQDMLKWREAKVLENSAASADEKKSATFPLEVLENSAASVDEGSRLVTLGLVGGDGLEYEFSRAAWLDNYKVPGQFVGVRLDSGGDGGVAGCLVAVTMDPTSVRQSEGKIQVLVTEEATFRLKGDTRGPAEETKGRSLAALEVGDKVKLSDFMGRGFSSLFVGWIGLQSALQEKRDIVIVASGARGLGSIKPVLDWPPVQAHAGIKQVSVYLEDESPASAAFLNDFLAWRSSGIRVTQCFTSETPGTPSNVEAAIFAGDEGLRAAVGGDPGAASFLIAGLPGKRAMELTDHLTDQGVDASRLLFNEFF